MSATDKFIIGVKIWRNEKQAKYKGLDVSFTTIDLDLKTFVKNGFWCPVTRTNENQNFWSIR